MRIDEPPGIVGAVTHDHLADLWKRLSQTFASDRAVFGYGLMNEPNDLLGADWKAISQQAVDAIRATGDRHPILVPGIDWSNAGRFADANGTTAWINDPTGEIFYEAHCYFDHDASGGYEMSYDQELAQDPGLQERGVRRLMHFAGWCAINQARGFIGEYGVPTDPRWLTALQHFLCAADNAGLRGCYWSAGEWWPPGDQLSIQPRDDFRTPAAQVATLLER